MLKKKPFFGDYPAMEIVTLVAIPISCLVVRFTSYTFYIMFGQPSRKLKDPFKADEN